MSNNCQTVVGRRQPREERGGEDRQEPNRQKEIVGDMCNKKGDQCLRLMSQNINGIGQKANSEKELGIKNFISE